MDEYYKVLYSWDLYAMCSYSEGLSRSLIECMNIGLICVSTYAGGSSEILDDCFLWEAGKNKDLASLIQYIIDLKPETLLEIGKKNKTAVTNLITKNYGKNVENFCKTNNCNEYQRFHIFNML